MPNTAESISTTPDSVRIVRYHMMAYCTSIEPNIDTVWPERKTAVSRFQRGRGPVVVMSVGV